MQLKNFDHVNLRTTRLQEMVDWYDNVLGLRQGKRPGFPFPGAWLYLGDHPFVHLNEIEPPEAAGSEGDLKLEHFAFTASGAVEFEARLKERGEAFRKVVVEDTGMVAFNIADPDGNHIHVDFPVSE